AQGKKPNKLQSEVREGYDSADSTHALRAKGGTNRSKSRCQCRRSARILVAQASCLQVARLPSLAANPLLPLLKQQRRKVRQIPPPHRPTMVAFGFAEVAANAVLLQHFDKLPAVLHQAIVLAARDPEQFEFFVRRLRIGESLAHRAFRVANEGTESTHPTEQFRVVQADGQRLAAAHGKAGNRPARGVLARAIVRLDQR